MSSLTTPNYWDTEWTGSKRFSSFDASKVSHLALDRIFTQLLPKEALKALEIGAGGSIWMGYFEAKFGYQVSGIDISWEGCLLTKRNYSGQTGKLPGMAMGDLFSPPFISEYFDLVYSLGVVEHFSDPVAALSAMKSLLKPGGILLTTIPNKAGFQGGSEKRINPENYYRHNPMTLQDLSQAHARAGFERLAGGYYGPMTLMGKSPQQAGLITRLFLRLNKLFSYRLAYPLFRRGFSAPWPRRLASSIYVLGHKGA